MIYIYIYIYIYIHSYIYLPTYAQSRPLWSEANAGHRGEFRAPRAVAVRQGKQGSAPAKLVLRPMGT